MSVNWNYYDKYDGIISQYMPSIGEGETKASQIVTAVNKLVYKWYNDGDVFDNTYGLEGWLNDLSSYANWLDRHTCVSAILSQIEYCLTDEDYENLLKELADKLLEKDFLAEQNTIDKKGSIYQCEGRFKFIDIDIDYRW